MEGYMMVWLSYTELKDYRRGRPAEGFTVGGSSLIQVAVPLEYVFDLEELEDCYLVTIHLDK